MAMAMACVGPCIIVRRPVRCRCSAVARKESLVLGIETSCDDTGAAVVSSGGRILGESLASQPEMLRQYGGVMPLAAQKNHEHAIHKVVEQALSEAKVRESDLSGVAVTIGPGLSLCLNVGVRKARSIARTWQLPFMGVHHMEAHALVVRLTEADVQFPFLVLLVSGGHNLLLVAKQVGEYVQLGTTLDDAIGEAYDKTARLLGLDLQHGGGPALEELALEGNPHSFKFSVPMRAHKDCNFSYAGLKAQVKLAIQSNKIEGPLSSATPSDRQTRANIAASFQRVAVVHVEDRCHRALQWAKEMEPSLHQMVLSGGVASNKYLRNRLHEVADKHNMKLFIPPPRLCTDNGVMVAWTGMEYLQLGLFDPPPQPDEPEESWVELKPRWRLGEVAEGRVEKSRLANSSSSLTSQVQRRRTAEEVCPMHSAAASISIQSLPNFGSSRKQTVARTPMASIAHVEVQKPLVAEEKAALLVPKALAWASLNGLVMGDKASERSVNTGVGIVHAPISLLPNPFPKPLFQQALELAPLFNLLVDRVSADAKFLQEALSRTRKVDSFTDRLLSIHSKITEEGINQTIQLGMHRSDYMCDMATGALLQVELNTISSSFAGLGPVVSRLHRYLLDNVDHLESSGVPENAAAADFGDILGLAWKEFANERAVVLFVVQPNERNMYDQAWLELKLFEKHGATVVRRTLTELHSQARIAPDRTLLLEGQAVAVIYYRSGYSPSDYPSDLEWDVRLMLERSTAIKCPSISYHLAGTKKIQQELAKPNVLERFMDDKCAVAKIRKCFAGLWSLEDEGSSNILNEAIQDPDLFVLKPQREGGGNNIYGSDVRSKLSELLREGSDGLAAYILMQRIFPPAHISYLVRGGIWSPEQTISELGIFGAYLRNGDEEIVNKAAGYLLRTKVSHSNEGGVATGFAVLDSVYLAS